VPKQRAKSKQQQEPPNLDHMLMIERRTKASHVDVKPLESGALEKTRGVWGSEVESIAVYIPGMSAEISYGWSVPKGVILNRNSPSSSPERTSEIPSIALVGSVDNRLRSAMYALRGMVARLLRGVECEFEVVDAVKLFMRK
jgi:hypothetical protein